MSDFTKVPDLKKSPLLVGAVATVFLILLATLIAQIKNNPTGFIFGLIKNPLIWFLLIIIAVIYATRKNGKELSVTSKIILVAVPIVIIYIVYFAYPH